MLKKKQQRLQYVIPREYAGAINDLIYGLTTSMNLNNKRTDGYILCRYFDGPLRGMFKYEIYIDGIVYKIILFKILLKIIMKITYIAYKIKIRFSNNKVYY